MAIAARSHPEPPLERDGRDAQMPVRSRVRRGARIALVVAFAAAAATLFRALAVECLEEDGPILVELAAGCHAGAASWYHAAYMPFGALVEWFVGTGRSLDALLWSSAIAAALGVTVVALAWWSRSGAGLVPLVALVCSPGLVVQATRLEVHALQFLGAAILMYAVCGPAPRSLGRLFAAALIALVCHRTHLGLVPGVAWLAASMATAGRQQWAALAVVAGAVAGHMLNLLAFQAPTNTVSFDVSLVLDYWEGPSAEHVWRELVVPWFPVLLLVAFHATRFDRRSLPFAAATLPLAVFFSFFGVGTSGGYFTGVCVFAAAAVADVRTRRPATRVERSANQRRGPALADAVCLATSIVGIAVGVSHVRAPHRFALELMGEQRHAAALAVLPRGGVFVSVDPSYQSAAGRTPGLEEFNLAVGLASSIAIEADPGDWARHASEIVGEHIALGREMAFDREWIAFAALEPRLTGFLGPLETLMREHHNFVEESHSGRSYLVRRASVSDGRALGAR